MVGGSGVSYRKLRSTLNAGGAFGTKVRLCVLHSRCGEPKGLETFDLHCCDMLEIYNDNILKGA